MLPKPVATPKYVGTPTTLAGLPLDPGERYSLLDLLDALAEEAHGLTGPSRRRGIFKGSHHGP